MYAFSIHFLLLYVKLFTRSIFLFTVEIYSCLQDPDKTSKYISSTMASFPNHEHRPLKKPRLGTVGPDIYLQDKKQKEV